MKIKIIRDEIKLLRAMAEGLQNALAAPLTEDKKQSLARYLEKLADTIEEAIAIEDETKY